MGPVVAILKTLSYFEGILQTVSSPFDADKYHVSLNTEQLRSEATFRFKIKNFSKLRMMMISSPCYIQGLPWVIRAGPQTMPSLEKDDQEKKYLSLGLKCDGLWGSTYWACFAIGDLRLLPVKKDQAPLFVGKSLHLFIVIVHWFLSSLTSNIQIDSAVGQSRGCCWVRARGYPTTQ